MQQTLYTTKRQHELAEVSSYFNDSLPQLFTLLFIVHQVDFMKSPD